MISEPLRKLVHILRVLKRGIEVTPKLLRNHDAWVQEMQIKIKNVEQSASDTERKVFYTCIGRALTSWAYLEDALVLVFSLLIRSSPEKGGLILFSITNFHIWLTLIHDLFEQDDTLKPFQKRWNKQGERIRGIKDKRDQLAHHRVLDSQAPFADFSTALKASTFDTRQKTRKLPEMTVAEISALTDTVINITEALFELIREMDGELKASSEKFV